MMKDFKQFQVKVAALYDAVKTPVASVPDQRIYNIYPQRTEGTPHVVIN